MYARSEDITANDGHAASTVDTIAVNTIGTGLTPQSGLDHKALNISEEDAREVERAQERAFREWSREAHAGRRMHFQDFQTLAIRSTVIFGEHLFLGRVLSEEKRLQKGRTFSFTLQDIHPLRLKTPPLLESDESIRDGVVMDEDGEPLGFWIANPESRIFQGFEEFAYCAARRGHRQLVFHSYKYQEPEQVRGVPVLAPVLKLFRDKYDFLDYEVVAQILTASFPMAIEMAGADLPENVYSQLMQQTGPDGSPIQTEKRWYQKLFPGQFLYLNPGERAHPLQSNRPGNNFDAFFKLILRTIGAVAGIPYEQIQKDFSQTNYSSARAALLEAWRVYQNYRLWLVRHFCQPVRAQVLEEAYLRGMWTPPKGAPDFYAAMDLWTACRWTPPPRGHVDPLKEVMANIRGIEAGLFTYADVLGEGGHDWDEHFAQQERERTARQKRGLPLVEPAKRQPSGQNNKPEIPNQPFPVGKDEARP